ncbi:MAG: hypothetical protein J0L57_05245 [Burkholderiales bacterium]|nr:hypothetical protein [Burkholderiales bacterium]
MPMMLIRDPLHSFNSSVQPGNEPLCERIPVCGRTLLECALDYGRVVGLPIEATNHAPVFRAIEENIFGEHGHLAFHVRRGSQLIVPQSFDFAIEESDEIEVVPLIC